MNKKEIIKILRQEFKKWYSKGFDTGYKNGFKKGSKRGRSIQYKIDEERLKRAGLL